MTPEKVAFLDTLEALMAKNRVKRSDIYNNTSISRSTLTRILDRKEYSLPDAVQLFELTDLLKTTPLYLVKQLGPERIDGSIVNEVIDMMNAYTDHTKPEFSVIIGELKNMTYDEQLFIRKVIFSLPSRKATHPK